jgi:hypothetical protein
MVSHIIMWNFDNSQTKKTLSPSNQKFNKNGGKTNLHKNNGLTINATKCLVR